MTGSAGASLGRDHNRRQNSCKLSISIYRKFPASVGITCGHLLRRSLLPISTLFTAHFHTVICFYRIFQFFFLSKNVSKTDPFERRLFQVSTGTRLKISDTGLPSTAIKHPKKHPKSRTFVERLAQIGALLNGISPSGRFLTDI